MEEQKHLEIKWKVEKALKKYEATVIGGKYISVEDHE